MKYNFFKQGFALSVRATEFLLAQKIAQFPTFGEKGLVTNMMSLTMARMGEKNLILKITGKDEIRQHLAELGFVVGGEVTVVSEIAGNMILSIKDSRVALDKTMANRIMI